MGEEVGYGFLKACNSVVQESRGDKDRGVEPGGLGKEVFTVRPEREKGVEVKCGEAEIRKQWDVEVNSLENKGEYEDVLVGGKVWRESSLCKGNLVKIQREDGLKVLRIKKELHELRRVADRQSGLESWSCWEWRKNGGKW